MNLNFIQNSFQVIHDCDGHHNRKPTADEMKKVQDLCEGQESCKFTPAPSFFGSRTCKGVKKTWVHWKCVNHIDEITHHEDGKQSCDKITKEGALHTRDFHSKYPEKNVFDLTCKDGCIKIQKVS